MSDLLPDSIFYWTFSSTTGDAYFGYTVADTAALGGVPVGAVFASPHGLDFGHYTVTNVANYAVDLSSYYGIGYYTEGANAVYSYYDAFDGLVLPTLYGSQGIPVTYTGLGGELDYVADPLSGGYEGIGYGGYYLVG